MHLSYSRNQYEERKIPPAKPKKPRIGIFSLTSCEGCILSILDDREKFLGLSALAELADMRLLKERSPECRLDVAIVEGCVISEKEARRLKKIRARSLYLISLGTCAGSGGVQANRNFLPKKQQAELLSSLKYRAKQRVMKIDLLVKVDYYIRGCPIDTAEFYSVIGEIIAGSKPKEPSAPVCFECKQRGVQCIYLMEDGYCLGPVTVGGCNAVCTANGDRCWGCRGFSADANIAAVRELLKKRGLTEKEIESLFRLYNNAGEENA